MMARLSTFILLLICCTLIHQSFIIQNRVTAWLAWFGVEDEIEFVFPTVAPTLRIPPTPDAVAVSVVTNSIALNKTSGERSPLDACNVTAQVKLVMSKPHWILQTLDSDGREKTVGGDELYVTYTDRSQVNESISHLDIFDPTAVAIIDDQGDGSYALDFVTTPMNPTPSNLVGTGRLTIHFQYSCGIGRLPPPTKHLWKSRGSTLVTHETFDVPAPPLRTFRAPSDGIDLNKHNLTIFFGDSLMQSLIEHHRNFFVPGRVYTRWNVGSELATGTVAKFVRDLYKSHKDVLSKPIGLVLGSAVWDILQPENIEQGVLFEDHLLACRQLVYKVREKYPNVTIYWKSPSAVHIHRLAIPCNRKCQDRTRYMSSSRAFYLYQKQKELMKEISVPFLDLYEAYYLSGGRTLSGDGRHYEQNLSKTMLQWFFPTYLNDDSNMAGT